MPPTTTSNDKVSQTVSRIENDNKQHEATPSKLHDEINQLRQQDFQNGKLDKSTFNTDLAAVTKQLHQDGVLPHLDIVGTGNGDAAYRGVSEPGKTPTNGDPSLVTKSHGTVFTYDNSGHVQSWSRHGETWKYDNQDGKYHESVNGKPTDKTTSDTVSVNGGGLETVTHADGSTTKTSAWGGTIDSNAQGQPTMIENRHDVKTFTYDAQGNVTSMKDYGSPQDFAAHKEKESFSLGPDGKLYSSNDKNHQNPFSISTKDGGVTEMTDKNGNRTDTHWGGEQVHWNSKNQLTEIDYSNGNKATNFKYDAATLDPTQNPLGTPNLSGFTFTGKDGKSHTYSTKDGNVSIDGGPGVKGTLTADVNGNLTATETGDGTDAQYKSIRFGLGGSQVESGKFAGQIKPEEVTNWGGHVNKFGYDASGALNSVDAYGYNLKQENGKWVDASGKPALVTPTIDEKGNFSITLANGTYDTWGPGGTRIEGIPDDPQHIAAEAKQVDTALTALGTTPDNTGGKLDQLLSNVPGETGVGQYVKLSNGAYYFDRGLAVDTDGVGTVPGDNSGTHQGSTSYADGRLDATKTNYVVLPTGDAPPGVQLGDLVAVRYKGQTQYAIYGDNGPTGKQGEGSYHLTQALGVTNGDPNASSAESPNSGVQYVVYPGTAHLLGGSVDQSRIDAVGSQLTA